jgi:uncharacterized glyoxalase superfamily protein PhnB
MSLDAIGIVSRNIALSTKFYALLSVDLSEKGGPDHFEGITPSGVRIMLDSVSLVKKINPTWKEPTGSAITLCFVQESPKAVDALYDKILAAGFKGGKAPWDAFWGQRYSSVLDPDDNQIDLFAPL